MKIFKFKLFLILIYWNTASYSGYKLVDFDISMGIQNRHQYNLMLRAKDSQKILAFYRDLFNKNNFDKINYSIQPKIPKIIHQIWVGPKPIPELYLNYAQHCQKLHPAWEYKLWREEDIRKENFPSKYMQLFKKMQHLYSGKKDIIEYLLLYKYGGVVMDMDFQCRLPLDELHHKYDFYAGLEPGVYWSKMPVMSNAIVGSRARNNLFIEVLDKAVNKYESSYKELNSGIRYYFRYLKSLFTKKAAIKLPDSRKILMMPLGEKFRAAATSKEISIVLPATYFNPIFPSQEKLKDKILAVLGMKNKNYFTQIREETIAVQDFND